MSAKNLSSDVSVVCSNEFRFCFMRVRSLLPGTMCPEFNRIICDFVV